MMSKIKRKVREVLLLRERALSELRGQVNDLEDSKEALLREVGDLRARNDGLVAEQAVIKAKVANLDLAKDAAVAEAAKSAELLKNLERSKALAEEQAEDLRLEVEKERLLNVELRTAVKALGDGSTTAKDLGLIAARQYTRVLQAFGGVTRELREGLEVTDIMKWFGSNFSTLEEFVMRAGDFAALSGVVNLLSVLEKKGCSHFDDFRKRECTFPSPAELGGPSKAVDHASHRFMADFWKLHGRAHACQLAEAKRAQVCVFSSLSLSFYCCCCFFFLLSVLLFFC